MTKRQTAIREFPCDLCGRDEAVEVPHCREYSNGQAIHICTNCGFVYVKKRRSAERIAQAWSEEIFGEGYTAANPAVVGRLTFVREYIHNEIGLKGKKVVEIGAGEGMFLGLAREKYGILPFGVEPSKHNCKTLRSAGVECFEGTIEQYRKSRSFAKNSFDVAVILWTLENCLDCREMLSIAYEMVNEGGYVAVATGSRILVPFKKPLQTYISKNPADTHCFRFSANTLPALLSVSGFKPAHINRYIDQDVLCVIGKKQPRGAKLPWKGDNYLDVYNFF